MIRWKKRQILTEITSNLSSGGAERTDNDQKTACENAAPSPCDSGPRGARPERLSMLSPRALDALCGRHLNVAKMMLQPSQVF